MDPKGDSSLKQATKKGNKKKPTPKSNYKLVNKGAKSSSTSGDLVRYPMKGKVGSREKIPVIGKKVITPENTLPKG